jgi:hypothetical protein
MGPPDFTVTTHSLNAACHTKKAVSVFPRALVEEPLHEVHRSILVETGLKNASLCIPRAETRGATEPSRVNFELEDPGLILQPSRRIRGGVAQQVLRRDDRRPSNAAAQIVQRMASKSLNFVLKFPAGEPVGV